MKDQNKAAPQLQNLKSRLSTSSNRQRCGHHRHHIQVATGVGNWQQPLNTRPSTSPRSIMERIHQRSREDTYDVVVLSEMWQGGADKMKLWVTNVPTSCDRYEIIHHIHPFGWFFGIWYHVYFICWCSRCCINFRFFTVGRKLNFLKNIKKFKHFKNNN